MKLFGIFDPALRAIFKGLDARHTPPCPLGPHDILREEAARPDSIIRRRWRPHVIIRNGQYQMDPTRMLAWPDRAELAAVNETQVWCNAANCRALGYPEWIEGPFGWIRNDPRTTILSYTPSGRPGIDY